MTTIQSGQAVTNPELIVNMLLGLRDDWDRPGIQAAIKRAMLKFDIELVHKVAIDTAKDITARTPGVIPFRTQTAFDTGKYTATQTVAIEMPVGHCGRVQCECDHRSCELGWISDDSEQPCPICRPHMIQAGIEIARRRAQAAAMAPLPASHEFVRRILAEAKAALPRHRNAETGQPEG